MLRSQDRVKNNSPPHLKNMRDYYYYYYYYYLLIRVFISAQADGLSLEIEWQQVSSSLQDFSQYSGSFQ